MQHSEDIGSLNSVPPHSSQLRPTLTGADDDKALLLYEEYVHLTPSDTDISTFHEYDFIHLSLECVSSQHYKS